MYFRNVQNLQKGNGSGNGAELMDCVGTELAYLFVEAGCCKPPEDKIRSKRCHNLGAASYLRDIDLSTYCNFKNKNEL